MNVSELTALPLPEGVRSRHVRIATGLDMHLLEAGHTDAGTASKPLVLLLHGFPELAFSWRHQLTALADAGFHVVAPDQRGYGRTHGSDDDFDGDWRACNMLRLVDDVLALVKTLGHGHVHTLIGHDFGSPVAAWCALTRPDIFHSVVLMSAPFAGPPDAATAAQTHTLLTQEVAALEQLAEPRQHYQWYYSNREANADMWHAPQGLHDFLRAYYHVKSADWSANQPIPLKAWQAEVLAALPHYYVMPYPSTMADAVAPFLPTTSQIQTCTWLTDLDLAVYVTEYARRGFQGGLQWYRCSTDRRENIALSRFSGQRITVPSAYIAGAADWGIYQSPGAFERMQSVCTQLRICQILPGAGHWVQQEQVEAVNRLLLEFVGTA